MATSFSQPILYTPLLFFSTIMLTEPRQAPVSRGWRLWYAFGTAFLLLPNVHIGSFYFTPELALLLGNFGTYLLVPQIKLILTLKEKIKLSPDVTEFVFTPDHRLAFKAGQYLEWTLTHPHPDARSIRRYFTIASSPTEPELHLGVKFYTPSSTFKTKLSSLQPGDTLVAAKLAGDFTLPRDPQRKLVFIAGGIGITPFRSMIQYLLDTHEKRSVTVFYANKTPNDVVYRELLERAQHELRAHVVYAFSDTSIPAPKRSYRTISRDVIEHELPDYKDHMFYISGPPGMVTAFTETLWAWAFRRTSIRTDFFPGYA